MPGAAIETATAVGGGMVPLWLKIAYTLMVCAIEPVYRVHSGPKNFLSFSDIALLTTVVALWLESPLLASMMALAVRADPQFRGVRLLGLSKARRAGVDLPPSGKGKASSRTRKSAAAAYARGHGKPARGTPSAKRSRAISKALKREGHSAASHRALSRQAHAAAGRRTAAQRSAAAKKAAKTKGAARRSAAARKAARTRAAALT